MADQQEGAIALDDGLVGLEPAEPLPPVGKMPNTKNQSFHGFMTGARYELAIVEFDDQGRCYDRGQMDGVASRLEQLSGAKTDAILLVFVHGWKHNARSDDDNLTEFRKILAAAAEQEASAATPRPVLGVFVGWRGLSEFGFGALGADATFWGRQATAQRVATGSVRELFGRLRTFRRERNKDAGAAAGTTILAIAGHSFGGMIVFAALAQSLIEAASTPIGRLTPGFADIVLLVNPAIEAARYLPIYDLVESPTFKARTTTQLPVFICVQARNDEPVGTWFVVGNAAHAAAQETTDELEKLCVTHALGFVPDFKNHTLAGPAGGKPFVLTPPEARQQNPFWIIEAEPEIVDGHGGIWHAPFKLFLASLLLSHVDRTKVGGAAAAALPQAGELADYARSIGHLFD